MTAENHGKILPGLLSITFRQLPAKQIVELAVEAQLAAIEWGGDLHVPHGDLATARTVRRMTEDSGLVISAYGSYFRSLPASVSNPSPIAVLDTAAELGTKTVRVWAGTRGSTEASASERIAVTEELASFCDLAEQRNLTVTTEFHNNTLTDDVESCIQLLCNVNCPNLKTFWQPPNGMDPVVALSGLKKIGEHLSHLHVFHWWPDHQHRLPLTDGADCWLKYLEQANKQSALDGEVRYASLEFVRTDNVELFRKDAVALRGWLGEMELGTQE